MFILIVSALIIIFAVIVQTITGFGFALIAVPLLLFIYTSQQAVAFTMILSFVSLLILTIKSRYYIRWRIVLVLFLSSIPGILLGAIWHGQLSTSVIKGFVGFIIFLFLAKNLYGYIQQRHKDHVGQELKEKRAVWYYVTGFLYGVLTGLIGMSGPIVVMLLVNVLPRAVFFATTVSLFAIEYFLAIGVYYALYPGIFDGFMLTFLLWMIIPILIGSYIGQKLRPIIKDDVFKKIVYLLLFIIGAESIFEFTTYLF